MHTDVWEGFVFVNLSREEPRPLHEHLADQQDEPLLLARFGLADLRIGHITTNEVQANWKIVLENYNECLHCPTIHPELVAVVPAYRKGNIFESGREDGGVCLADGRTAIVDRPAAAVAVAAGLQGPGRSRGLLRRGGLPHDVPRHRRLDLPGHGGVPDRPASCRLVTEYLFSPEAFEDPDFDPSPVVQFNELVTRQDGEACERVQRGVTSRAFDHGVFPAKDSWVHGFDQRYLRDVEATDPARPARRGRRHPRSRRGPG